MKWPICFLMAVLLPTALLADPVGTLDVARAVTIATNAVAQQLPHVSLDRLRFDHAELQSDSGTKQFIIVWFYLPIPDRKWEERGMNNGKFVSVKMLPNGTQVTASESKGTVARKSETQLKDNLWRPYSDNNVSNALSRAEETANSNMERRLRSIILPEIVFDNADIRDVLQFIERTSIKKNADIQDDSAISFVVQAKEARNVTYRGEYVSVWDVLQAVVLAADVGYEIGERRILIVDKVQ